MPGAGNDRVGRLREGARIDAEPGEGVEQDGGCDRAPDQSRDRAIIGAADPDADRVLAVEADSPGIAIAIGGAGLVGDAAGHGVERWWSAKQGVGDIPGRDGIDEARSTTRALILRSARRARLEGWSRARWSILRDAAPWLLRMRAEGGGGRVSEAQRQHLAAAGQSDIGAGQILQGDAEAAEPDGEAGRAAVLGHGDRDAGITQAREEALGAERGQQFDGGHVERKLQGLARADHALEGHIEILGDIDAVTRRPVLQHRLGMGDAVVEGERVDEGLQRRARRAQCPRQVERAGALRRKIIDTADRGADLAGLVVDGEDRDRDLGGEAEAALAR